MNTLLLILIALGALAMIGRGLLYKGRALEFPFLFALALMGYLFPQLSLLASVGAPGLPTSAITKLMLMVGLCLLAVELGWNARTKPFDRLRWSYNDSRLTLASVLLVVFGCYFYIRLYSLPPEYLQASQWSGVAVAFLFLAQTFGYGFTVAVLVFLRRGWTTTLLICLAASTFYMHRIVLAGRRAAAVEFLAIVSMSLWFTYKLAPPRWLVCLVGVAGMFWITSIFEYRHLASSDQGPRWRELMKIDLVKNYQMFMQSDAHEATNAAFQIEGASQLGVYDYGMAHWNRLVMNFVPSQLVGARRKEALLLNLPDPAFERFRYVPKLGTPSTGFGDAFLSFGYLGAIKFFLISYLLRGFYIGAQDRDMLSQLVYILTVTDGLNAATHTTQYFLTQLICLTAFLLPCLLYSLKKGNPRTARQPAPAPPPRRSPPRPARTFH